MLLGLKLKEGDYIGAQNILNTLPVNTINEQNLVDIQQINLQRLSTGISFNLSEAEELQLQNIAESELSSRTYARSLLFLLKGQRFPLDLDFGETNKSLNIGNDTKKGKTSPFMLFPNPANESVKINYPVYEDNTKLLLEVIDLNGKVLKSIHLDNNGEYFLNTANLDEGIFVVQISNGKQIRYQNKLVLIH